MTPHERAERLFRDAEEEGLDAAPEGRVADAISDAVYDAYTDCELSLKQAGFGQAAAYLARLVDRMHAGDRVLHFGRKGLVAPEDPGDGVYVRIEREDGSKHYPPNPEKLDDCEWQLRYGDPASVRFLAASVVGWYRGLFRHTDKVRRKVMSSIARASKAAGGGREKTQN